VLSADNVEAHRDAEAISVFIYSQLDAALLARLPALKIIATRSTGFDHIDLRYCAERGITVANVPSYGENTVAEHVFALLLTISHRMLEANSVARSGRFSPRGLQGFDLQGRTMGVVGTGKIGEHVVRIAKGFDMRVLACDDKPNFQRAEALGFDYVPFAELLARADVISLHVPATPQTHYMIGTAQFAAMKPGAVLINTARGSIVEPGALIQALISGKLAAAGLDVLPDEPSIREEAQLISSVFNQHQEADLRGLVADHVLLNMPNVVVTPHSGFNTVEAVARIAETTVDNLRAFAANAPFNRVV
jgi:D-lactate dehydrogenase